MPRSQAPPAGHPGLVVALRPTPSMPCRRAVARERRRVSRCGLAGPARAPSLEALGDHRIGQGHGSGGEGALAPDHHFRLLTLDQVLISFGASSQFFVCGSNKVASAVKQTIVDFFQERTGSDEAGAREAFDKIMQGRYATDIFD